MVKEILFLSYHFAPYSKILSIRAAEFAKRLIQLGYKIFVVRAKVNKNALKDGKLLEKVDSPLIENHPVFNLSFSKEGIQSNLKKVTPNLDIINFLLFFHWIPLAFLTCRKLIKRNNIRLIYASAPPFFTLLLGFLLKKIYKIPLIIEYRDPWSYNPYLEETAKTFIDKTYLKIEKKILKSADSIICISDGMKQFLIEKFPDQLKNKDLKVIPHGVNFEEISQIALKKKLENEIIITFTGNLYGLRNLKPLIKIISSSKKFGKLDGISLKIKIFGRYDSGYLENLIKKYDVIEYFNLQGFVPRDMCFEEVYNSSLALHVGEDLNYPTLSFKVLEYLSMRKKIMYLGKEDSYTAKFLEENDMGFTIPINDFNAGLNKFGLLIEKIKSKQISLEILPNKLKSLTWDKNSNELADIFKKFFN
ncbi:MAG: glycosyltransferase [Promethearchaeota archaeon]